MPPTTTGARAPCAVREPGLACARPLAEELLDHLDADPHANGRESPPLVLLVDHLLNLAEVAFVGQIGPLLVSNLVAWATHFSTVPNLTTPPPLHKAVMRAMQAFN